VECCALPTLWRNDGKHAHVSDVDDDDDGSEFHEADYGPQPSENGNQIRQLLSEKHCHNTPIMCDQHYYINFYFYYLTIKKTIKFYFRYFTCKGGCTPVCDNSTSSCLLAAGESARCVCADGSKVVADDTDANGDVWCDGMFGVGGCTRCWSSIIQHPSSSINQHQSSIMQH